jgi:hypothetical protein
VQSLPSFFLTAYYKILCSVPSDEAVPEEGAGIYPVYMWKELAGMKSWAGWSRAFLVFFTMPVTKFFVLCL